MNGYKTYIVSALMVALGLADMALIDVPHLDGAELLLEGLALAGLRSGITREARDA